MKVEKAGEVPPRRCRSLGVRDHRDPFFLGPDVEPELLPGLPEEGQVGPPQLYFLVIVRYLGLAWQDRRNLVRDHLCQNASRNH